MSITDMTITDMTGQTDAEVPAEVPAEPRVEDLSGHIDLTRATRLEPPAPLDQVSTGFPSARPTFTITDAAVACAVSRKTITRKLGDLAEHGAAKDDDGIWRIPVEALLAVGLHPGRSLRTTQAPAPRPMAQPSSQTPTARPEHVAGDMVTVSRDRWDDLRIRLARAEAEASERALALADARLALRALTAAPAAQTLPAMAAEPVVRTHEALPDEPVSADAQALVTSSPVRIGSQGSVSVSVPTRAAALDEATEPVGPDSAADMASARSQAARTGGYVPAAGAAQGRKRRWWHSK